MKANYNGQFWSVYLNTLSTSWRTINLKFLQSYKKYGVSEIDDLSYLLVYVVAQVCKKYTVLFFFPILYVLFKLHLAGKLLVVKNLCAVVWKIMNFFRIPLSFILPHKTHFFKRSCKLDGFSRASIEDLNVSEMLNSH